MSSFGDAITPKMHNNNILQIFLISSFFICSLIYSFSSLPASSSLLYLDGSNFSFALLSVACLASCVAIARRRSRNTLNQNGKSSSFCWYGEKSSFLAFDLFSRSITSSTEMFRSEATFFTISSKSILISIVWVLSFGADFDL